MQIWIIYCVSIARFVWGGGLALHWFLLTPQICIDPRKIVKISQNYIAAPLVFAQIEYMCVSLEYVLYVYTIK